MNMSIHYANYLNTTTMVSVDSGTDTTQYLFGRESSNQYQTSGDNSDATTSTIVVNFTGTEEVDRIILQNINLKSFKMYYDSNTANLFSITSALTGTTEWTNNSATSLYLILEDTKTIGSITIEATATMLANEEKKIGEMWITKNLLTFDQNPQARGYRAETDRKEWRHEMSDGGVVVYALSDKFSTRIKRKYVDQEEYDTLKTIHRIWDAIVFVPFPTGTAWNSEIYEVTWTGAFTFETFSDNYKENGYSGTIKLEETPN